MFTRCRMFSFATAATSSNFLGLGTLGAGAPRLSLKSCTMRCSKRSNLYFCSYLASFLLCFLGLAAGAGAGAGASSSDSESDSESDAGGFGSCCFFAWVAFCSTSCFRARRFLRAVSRMRASCSRSSGLHGFLPGLSLAASSGAGGAAEIACSATSLALSCCFLGISLGGFP